LNSFHKLCALLSLCLLLLAGCGGGGDHNSPPTFTNNPASSTSSGSNVAAITVSGGPANNINLPMTSLTICAPNSTVCQTINDVLVDTGSSGVRIFAGALAPTLNLPEERLADGSALVECTPFADGSTWGPVKVADIRVAGESATDLPVQIIGDPHFPAVPATCSNTGPMLDTPQLFGANGVLGVGVFRQDCGAACEHGVSHGIYFGCAPGACSTVAAPLAQQVQNPVSFFAVNNNGVAVTLPAVPEQGAANVAGTLVFGIDTQTNNVPTGKRVLTVDRNTGLFTTVYKGNNLRRSFIDSGSNGLFFNDSTIPPCSSGFYCPPATLLLTATTIGANGAQDTISFSVVNADSVIKGNPGNHAFNHLAGSVASTDTFDWGLPFFFGRTVFTALESSNTSVGTGPYFAY
jgi:hypothetical protein